MIQIMCDSSTLYSTEEGKKKGLIISPLSVSLEGKTYTEYDEISSEQFLKLLENGGIPASSQPSIGAKMDLYEAYKDDDIIDITMADGLSGTYQSALMAQDQAVNKDRIRLINSKTLCGPHRYLVQKAVSLKEAGKDVDEIVKAIEESVAQSCSFLVPMDYGFLKRGGRLTPMAATFGGMLKLVPMMTQTPDGTRLEKHGVKRTFKGAVEEMIRVFKEKGVDENYHISVSHANNLERAQLAKSMLEEAFDCDIHLYLLSPAFITQGGPGCVALQAIKK